MYSHYCSRKISLTDRRKLNAPGTIENPLFTLRPSARPYAHLGIISDILATLKVNLGNPLNFWPCAHQLPLAP